MAFFLGLDGLNHWPSDAYTKWKSMGYLKSKVESPPVFDILFSGNGFALTTNKYCDFNATVTCYERKMHHACPKLKVHNKTYSSLPSRITCDRSPDNWALKRNVRKVWLKGQYLVIWYSNENLLLNTNHVYLKFRTSFPLISLRWRHNGRDGVSNHQPHDCLLNRLFRRRSKKTSKLRVTGLCAGTSLGTGEFPAKWPVTRKMFPFDDVIMLINFLI